jgi:hypothetical protein
MYVGRCIPKLILWNGIFHSISKERKKLLKRRAIMEAPNHADIDIFPFEEVVVQKVKRLLVQDVRP